MARHTEFGKKAEALAADWLVEQGYTILRRNWRHGRYEVDIIAQLGDICHIIEVKAVRTTRYGHPEEKVDKKKIRRLMNGAAAWLHQFPGALRVQYDVVAMTMLPGEEPQFLLIGDVYA